MNPEMFREYDIRGVAGEDMSADEVILIGKGIGSFFKRNGCRRISVGRDCRITSDLYAQKLAEGLNATGCDIVDIGVCPTPILYFSILHLHTDGGVMVTASHNPPQYNGFKLNLGEDSIHGKDIQIIREMIETADFESGSGGKTAVDVVTPYMAHLEAITDISKKLRIGVDAGNGTAGVIAVPLMKKLGCEVHGIYCDMDGNFPNHEADPTVLENVTDLIAMVKDKKLDLGISYDGDGDRIGVVDEKGNIIYGDRLMILFSREILSRKPGAVFVSEVKCSKTMYDDIEKHGGQAIMWKTGHSLIKQKMREVNAELAGEMSGHMFFADRYFGYDDAVYASLRLLEILSRTDRPLSALLDDVPKTFSTPEIRVECPDNRKFEVVRTVSEYFRSAYNVVDIDGVRVLFDDGWGLVRASNTQPALVLRFEATTEARLQYIRNLVESALEEAKNNR